MKVPSLIVQQRRQQRAGLGVVRATGQFDAAAGPFGALEHIRK